MPHGGHLGPVFRSWGVVEAYCVPCYDVRIHDVTVLLGPFRQGIALLRPENALAWARYAASPGEDGSGGFGELK